MEPKQIKPEVMTDGFAVSHNLTCITPLSKYLALAMFIILPFLGGYVGYVYAPEKVVEVENVVIKEIELDAKQAVEVPPQALIATDYGLYADINFPYTSGAQAIIVEESEIYGKPLNFEDGNLVFPESIVYVTTPEGPIYIGKRYGDCKVNNEDEAPFNAEDVSSDSVHLAQMKCTGAGGGSELYLYELSDDIYISSRTVGECGVTENCSPYGNLEIILKLNKTSGEIMIDRTKELRSN